MHDRDGETDMSQVPLFAVVLMSFGTLRYGTASNPALLRSKALVSTWRQDPGTLRELRTFTVTENFTRFWERNISMVRSITCVVELSIHVDMP
jgi:hypothetical protein